MPHPNVTAIFPSFDDPDHFERTMTGRYICKLCPQGDRLQRTFNTDKAALAHERSTDHIYYAELEKNNPWNAEPGADSAGWGSDAAIEQLLTTEEVKDLEYRKRVSDLPDTIEKWRAGFLTFARDDAMLPVDEPPQSRRKSRRNKAVKNANTSTESKVEQASETVLPGVWQPVKSIATSSIEGRDVRSRPPVSHFHIHNISTSTASSRPTVDAARIPMRPRTKKLSTSPPTELTPELRKWMAKMVIEMRFSPTRARQMREFIQLPTDTKVDMIQHSAWDLRAMLLA